MPWHLKEQLFHGVKKHARDSVRYLYSNPQTTYSELVVAARRAESKMEETKVKARSAATTEVPSSSKELGDQIARLMATLTRAEQGSHLPVPPVAQGTGVVGEDRQTGPLLSAQTPTMVGLAWAKPLLPTALQLPIGQVSNPHVMEINMCRMVYGWYTRCLRLQPPAMHQVPGLGPHGQGACNSGSTVKQGRGDLRECSQTPLQQSAVSSKCSLCDPKPKPTQEKAVNQKGWKGIAPIPFLNPDPVAQLVGCANEAPVVVDGCEVAALVDLGAQVSNISAQLCEELGLEIQHLGRLLEFEGTGGAAIPYLGFVEVNLQIPGIRGYNKDVLLLAIPTTAYTERVPVVVGLKIIDRALSCMTVGELACATATWQQAHFGAVMSGSLQLSCSSSEKLKLDNFSRENDPVEVQKYQLDGVKGAICTTQKVTIPPFQTVNIKANAGVKGHCMKVHVLTEPVLGPQLPAAVVPIATYGELHLGSSRVPVCLSNMSTHAMEIPAKTVVGQVIPANQIPLVVHPTRTAKATAKIAPKGWVLEALDLQGLKEWLESEQRQVRELLLKWEHLFAHSDLDLGKTALIKHKIPLTEQTPFKERYRHIPPHMYNDVRAHIQEMLEIGAIHKSHSLWASAVVLVQKKDGGLRFCIDLRKLNE